MLDRSLFVIASQAFWTVDMNEQQISQTKIENWREDRLPNLSGKCFVITGGNSGIGFQAAQMLGRRGADLILACRSAQKATSARMNLEASSTGTVNVVTLDLADRSSIYRASDGVRAMTKQIDGLINNAGIMQTPHRLTADGFELQFGTNHLGHFLWTSLLLDRVEAAGGRVVQVSSIAHRLGRIHFDDLMGEKTYSSSKAYAQSKLANLMFALELDRRLAKAQSPAIALACHPGYSNTNLQSTGPTGILNLIYKPLNALIAQPSALGAVPTVLAAAGTEAQRGRYYGPTGFYDMRGPVSQSYIAPHALDQEQSARLWAASERLLGISFLSQD